MPGCYDIKMLESLSLCCMLTSSRLTACSILKIFNVKLTTSYLDRFPNTLRVPTANFAIVPVAIASTQETILPTFPIRWLRLFAHP